MQTTILSPSSPGKYPGIVFSSEIFQLKGPIMRTATALAGHGFVVAVPEIYHTTSAGWVGEYTTEGADEGNRLKVATPAESHDGDSAAVLAYLRAHPACTGKLGTAGFCIGGHLSLRAAMVNDGVSAVASWYPTDMHTGDGVCAGLVDRTKVGVKAFCLVLNCRLTLRNTTFRRCSSLIQSWHKCVSMTTSSSPKIVIIHPI
jgi:dienelactone hydrolase